MTPKQSKSQIKAAQAKHLADLFGEEAVPAASTQQAHDQRSSRAQKLSQAAQDKQRQLPADEAAKLAELQQRQAQAKAATPAPSAPAPQAEDTSPAPVEEAGMPDTGLVGLSSRNDLADAALRNMQQHARRQRQAPQPTAQPEPTSAAAPSPQPAPPTQPQPAPAAPSASETTGSPAQPARRRPAPSPEELDRLLRAMAQRSRQPGSQPRPASAMSGRGAEGAPDAAPQVETPPDVPEEAPEKNQEKQAEIIERLKAREAQTVQQTPNLPEPDQQRVDSKPVEVRVPIVTEDNAVSAAPLHQALEDLAREMGAKNPPGQVEGINKVQREMPGHPLREQGDSHG
jgi:hypothetical protein